MKFCGSQARQILVLSACALITACGGGAPTGENPLAGIEGFERKEGFFDLYWDDGSGRLLLAVSEFDEPFLYQSSLARGVGSNDIGLDRGQLGATRVVRFFRSGSKILLIEDNVDYRASSDDGDEQAAVAESFATTVVWGFEALGERGNSVIVDATEFLLRDSHRIAARLAGNEEGDFAVDPTRSAVYMPMTKSFPDNSEMEAIVTFVGEATGQYLPTVAPDRQAFSVHLHHSFIRLPDDGYEAMQFEPRSGFFGLDFQDYATDIGESLRTTLTVRHRLEKKDPSAAVSEAVEPIIYYVDRGAPEPVRQALIDGALWWNQAFEAAGYRDAFQVELLPEDADPMDVRYNIIQWVHRSTRGWSYGSSIRDPRTGEILKGKVTLGSLRVRQDYLIAEGLLSPYDDEERNDAMLDMALARIRQLSAHEVGHTLGIQHNMAASTQDRASVMDYPHPVVRLDAENNVDLSDAYDVGIGEWDKRVIIYGYQDFPDDADRQLERDRIMQETIDAGFVYVSDGDSRAISSAHPRGNLWDFGEDPLDTLIEVLAVRAVALERFSLNNIREGRPLATLEEVLVPLYLLHRFQLIATGKIVGGIEWTYTMRGDNQAPMTALSAARQRSAISALVGTLTPNVLRLPANIVELIPPRPPGYPDSREMFPGSTGKLFDPLGAARSAASLSLDVLLEPTRAARLIAQHAGNPAQPGFDELLEAVIAGTWQAQRADGADARIQRAINVLVLERLLALAMNVSADAQVRAMSLDAVLELEQWLAASGSAAPNAEWRAHYRFARFRIAQVQSDPSSVMQFEAVTVPPGEPIGETLDWEY